MNLDSVATSHPIVQKIETVEQISQAFDSITYRKGEAVLTMLEDYVGEDAWRQGVRDYIATYRLKNTVTDNLWEKVEHAAGKPVTAIAHDFTLQAGVPLIRVEAAECRDGNTNVTLRQAEFSRDDVNKKPLRWRVPVIASTLGGAEVRTLVSDGTGSITVPGCEPLIVNRGQTGYYRTLYPPPLLERLKAAYPRLKPVDQLGLLTDNRALGLAGYQPATAALDLLDAIPVNANTKLWARAAEILTDLYDRYEGDAAAQAAVARYGSAKLHPVFERLGWDARPNEKPNDAVLRAALITALGRFGDPDIVAEETAATRPAIRRPHPARSALPFSTSLPGKLIRHVDRLHSDAQREKNPLVRQELYQLLGGSRDEALARRALELSLTDEPGATTSSHIVSAVASSHPDLAFDFALANREKVEAQVDVSSRSRYFPSLAEHSSNATMVNKLEDYAQRFMTPQSRKSADVAIAAIKDRIRVRDTRLKEVTRWFQEHR